MKIGSLAAKLKISAVSIILVASSNAMERTLPPETSLFSELESLIQLIRKERVRLEHLYWAGSNKKSEYVYAVSLLSRYEIESRDAQIIYRFSQALYHFHQGTRDSLHEALRLFFIIEAQGINLEMKAAAQFYLGVMYFQGKGVDKNPETAKKYFLLVKDTPHTTFGRIAARCYLGQIFAQETKQLPEASDDSSDSDDQVYEDKNKRALIAYYWEEIHETVPTRLLTSSHANESRELVKVTEDLRLLRLSENNENQKLEDYLRTLETRLNSFEREHSEILDKNTALNRSMATLEKKIKALVDRPVQELNHDEHNRELQQAPIQLVKAKPSCLRRSVHCSGALAIGFIVFALCSDFLRMQLDINEITISSNELAGTIGFFASMLALQYLNNRLAPS